MFGNYTIECTNSISGLFLMRYIKPYSVTDVLVIISFYRSFVLSD